jgi:dUTP pyrophosphatase
MLFCETILHSNEDGVSGIMPEYQTLLAACADVASPTDEMIPAHKGCRIDLLVSFRIPAGYKILMYPRSSLLIKKGLMQPVSVIDEDYTGHVHVPVFNMTDEPVHIEAGERIAQIELVPVETWTDLPRKAVERNGGFGSTGK